MTTKKVKETKIKQPTVTKQPVAKKPTVASLQATLLERDAKVFEQEQVIIGLQTTCQDFLKELDHYHATVKLLEAEVTRLKSRSMWDTFADKYLFRWKI